MEDYIFSVLRYIFGNNNQNKGELSDLEKTIDSPNYRDKYFNYNEDDQNLKNNNTNNQNTDSNCNDNIHENIRNIRDDYGNDFVIMI